MSGTIDAAAQDLEPRAYSASPIGTNFLLMNYSYSRGDVGVDASLPVKDLKAGINIGQLGFSHTFDMAGRMASYAMQMPYAQAQVSGQVFDQSKEISRSGLAGVRARFAINVLGCPALTPSQFARRKSTTTIGLSLSVTAPTGSYDPAHFINIGTNRWSFRPEVGVEQPLGKWFVDGAAGIWLFTTNHNFFNGHDLSQNPLSEFQAHAGYNFRPGLWLAADANYYAGGEISINGKSSNTSLANTRYGLTLSDPLGQGFSAKLAWSNWLGGTFGNEYSTLGLTLQYRWFDR